MSDDLLIDTPPVRRSWINRLFPRRGGGGGVAPDSGGWRSRRLWRLIKWAAICLVVFAALYYPVGMIWIQKINDDTSFSVPDVPEGASQAVAISAALLDREVNHTAWPANHPIFLPGWALDNMPNFQKGIILALRRFSIELQDQIGRNRGTSSADPDLQTAASALNYAPDVWVVKSNGLPTSSSVEQYNNGMKALLAYNARLAKGNAAFERRADNLIDTLSRIGTDLGAASEKTNRQIDENSGNWVDFYADDVFYQNKGLLYADALILRDLGKDFKSILAEKGAQNVWDRMVQSMMEGAELRPWIVINGRPDALMQPNHLAAQGFYLIRARAQLEELNDILIK